MTDQQQTIKVFEKCRCDTTETCRSSVTSNRKLSVTSVFSNSTFLPEMNFESVVAIIDVPNVTIRFKCETVFYYG